MRVLIGHVPYRLRGGEDVVVDNEVRLLSERGHDVELLHLRNDDLDEHTLRGRVGMGVGAAWSRDGARQLDAAIARSKPQVVHLHNTFPRLSASAYMAAHRHGVPVVHTLHNFRLTCANGILFRGDAPCEACLGALPWPALRHGCYRGSRAATAAVVGMQVAHRAVNAIGKGATRYIALTEFARVRLARAGLALSKLTVKPNFLPQVPPPPGPLGRYALYVGRLSPEKGVDAMVDAWRDVRGKLPLRIVGDGPSRPIIEQAAARAVATGADIELLGQRTSEAVALLMAQARFVIVPSLCFEGFPMVVVEAMAAGRPLLVSRLGSLDELVEEGTTGYKFRAGDASAIAACVNAAVDSPEQLDVMASAARRRFEANYSPDAAGVALEAIYASLGTGA